jgi:hypothetical protein
VCTAPYLALPPGLGRPVLERRARGADLLIGAVVGGVQRVRALGGDHGSVVVRCCSLFVGVWCSVSFVCVWGVLGWLVCCFVDVEYRGNKRCGMWWNKAPPPLFSSSSSEITHHRP